MTPISFVRVAALTSMSALSFSPEMHTIPSSTHFHNRSSLKMVSSSGKSNQGSEATHSKSRRLFSFVEARKMARAHGFDSKQEFLEYSCPGAYHIPKDADLVWKEEWRGWDDFLGIPFSYDEACQIIQSLEGIDSKEKYIDWMERKEFSDDDPASRLPLRPDLMYKEVWEGWDNFLTCK